MWSSPGGSLLQWYCSGTAVVLQWYRSGTAVVLQWYRIAVLRRGFSSMCHSCDSQSSA